MKEPSKKENRGGARPGAGRKPGLRSPRSKKPRQIFFSPELWARLDAEQERLGWTRSALFEDMAEKWLATRPNPSSS